MPTFTTIALETLLEPRIRDSCKNGLKSNQLNPNSELVHRRNEEDENREVKMKVRAPNHIYISPALYVTPEPTPVPSSVSDPLSPSPYVFNHKGRGGASVDRRCEENPRQKCEDVESNSNLNSGDRGGCDFVEEEVGDDFGGRNGDPVLDDEVFTSPCGDSVSIIGSVDGVDNDKQAEIRSFVSNQGEFFDADEEFFSDVSTPNSSLHGLKAESELRATRLSLLDEIEKRKNAELAVRRMFNQWQRLGNLLSQNGLLLPPPPEAASTDLDIDLIDQLSQELVVARFVAEAIGRGEARAKAELDAEAVIQSKDHEISRLRDRLKYYEAVNHEMSQRNQQVLEAARRQRQRRRSQRRWLWSCLGISAVVGACLIAYSYVPQSNKPQMLPSPNDVADASYTMESTDFE